MIGFIARRLLQTALLLFFLSIFVFFLFQLIPGDYLAEMELNPAISRQTIQDLRVRYGMDRSLIRQYFSWLSQAARGNLGYSFAQQRPAQQLILERLANTLLLAATTLCLVLLVAIPLGLISGLWAGR